MRICIVCQKEVAGKSAYPVKEDFIIRTIRGFKQTFRVAANNELYVCEDDLEAHREKRKSFEHSLIFFGVLSAAVVILLIGTILFSGRFDIFAILSAIIIGFFILLFAVVFKYAPAMEKVPSREGRPVLPEELEKFEEKAVSKKKR